MYFQYCRWYYEFIIIITYNIPSALIISGNFFECFSKTY
jgi:hypothetical protein